MERAAAKSSYGNVDVKRAGAMDESERNHLILQYAPLVKFLASRMAMSSSGVTTSVLL